MHDQQGRALMGSAFFLHSRAIAGFPLSHTFLDSPKLINRAHGD
jgi:hypothetical protein